MSKFKLFNVNPKFKFILGSEDTGKLYEGDDGLLYFDGKVDESAKIFFEYLCNINNTHIAITRNENRQLQHDKEELVEVLSTLSEHMCPDDYCTPEEVEAFLKINELLEKHKC